MSADGYTEVCRLADLPDPGAREFTHGPGDWPFEGFVVRVDGVIRAFQNVCPHKRFPLNQAPDQFLTSDGRLIRCAAHEALFEPESGLCVFGPCAGRRLTGLECRLEGDRVLVRVPSGTVTVSG